MADEVLYSSLGDLRVAEVLETEILLKLADRESFFQHPAIVFLGDASGQGSDTSKVGLIGFDGSDVMAAVGSETTATSNTALTDASATCSIARQALQYEVSDLARLVDSSGMISLSRFAQSLAGSANMRLTAMLANLVDNFATTAGTTAVDMTVDDYFDAIYGLELNSVPGPYLCVLHPRQYADFQNSLRSESGALQWTPATAEQLVIRGPGYKGSYAGVEIFVSSHVPTANANADRAGGMFGRGALGYKVGSMMPDPNVPGIYAGPLFVEFERSASYGLTKTIGNLYAGATEIEDLRGVSIITDA
jgi:hypothetical protein